MSELRWILLALGVIVVAYVYWRGRNDQQRTKRSLENRIEPTVRSSDLDMEPSVDERRAPALGNVGPEMRESAVPRARVEPAAEPPAAPPPRPVPVVVARPAPARTPPARAPGLQKPVEAPPANKIVALRIAKREGGRIPGTALVDTLRKEGLEFGEYKIFHRYVQPAADDRTRVPLFSVANMVEPGELDPERSADLEVPGVAVFMVLPGVKTGVQALTDMLNTARRVASALDAELLDQNGSTMTRQTADHLRDEVIEFEHRHRSEHQASS